jgi:phosphotransferase system HPr (HPr) family protein
MTHGQTRIRNELGLHLRSASNFVRLASRFQAKILVATSEAGAVDGKSILGLATLGAAEGTELVITAEGPDEAEAVRALVELVESRFNEER